MRVGGTRKVKISPHLAYQQTGVPGIIPANAVLIYEIELLGVE
ncbi:MAG: FKBP-type peptidyl-prolyl cis-trans isomerase [Thiothrix litoralis]